MSEYSDKGLESDRSYRFMTDMSSRMECSKGMSTGQRKYLDSLIDQGIPTPKNEERVKEILAAAEVDGMQQSASTLKDFAFKLSKGWNLSEKQEKFLSKLLAKAETVKVEGRFRPAGELLEDLKSAAAICKIKNSWYWQHRPGTAKAYDKVRVWLEWSRTKTAKDEIEASIPGSIIQIELEPIIDQWACDKLLEAVKNQISELRSPRHPEGSMVWKVMYNGTPKSCAIITGPPTLKDGKIFYPCLVSGEDILVISEDLKKRRG